MDDYFYRQQENDFAFAYRLSQEEVFPTVSKDDEMSYQLALKLQNEEMYPVVSQEDQLSIKLAQQMQKEEEENEARYLKRICEEEDKKKREQEEKLSFDLVLRLQKQEKELSEKDDMDILLAKELQKEYEEELSLRMAARMNEDSSSSLIDEIVAQELQAEEYRNYGPGYWTEPLGNLPFRRVRLPSHSKLYTFVQQKFSSTNCIISFIEYIQNENVWNSYHANKLQTNLPEVYRFHGTPHTNVEGISQYGFLTSKDVSGRGTTIWSAEQPAVSVGYARKGPAPDGTHFMFLAKVLSTTANISTVRDGSTMYPEFLIAFKTQ